MFLQRETVEAALVSAKCEMERVERGLAPDYGIKFYKPRLEREIEVLEWVLKYAAVE